jgi:heat shock protein HslJ
VPEGAVPLSYTEWRLVELEDAPVDVAESERQPHLVFDLEESRVAGSGGVNRIMGTFVLAEDELRFGPLATTMMAGSEEAMQRERAFLDVLARVTSYQLDGDALTLHAGDEAVARFSG